jgi:hypothetical protein
MQSEELRRYKNQLKMKSIGKNLFYRLFFILGQGRFLIGPASLIFVKWPAPLPAVHWHIGC